ncbi:MAG: hypothetical protein JWN93_2554 [Hyphomicrobiales bacterium]|nr:hypothetical protein [Hyphomicrobiales bacterium]
MKPWPKRTVGLCHRASCGASLLGARGAGFSRLFPVRGACRVSAAARAPPGRLRRRARLPKRFLIGLRLAYVLRGAALAQRSGDWALAVDESGSDRRDGASEAPAAPQGSGGRALVQNAAQKLRDERLALALRENLRRRKAQARGRRDGGPDEGAGGA